MEHSAEQRGTAPFTISSIDIPCFTAYRVFGDLKSGRPPVIVLHGGPGSGHEYLVPFAQLWEKCGLPVVFYDQIGCGSSTHLRQKAGDHSFWQPSLFVAQLDSLLAHLEIDREDGTGYHILGHSWGGVLGIAFASRQPRGLRRLILASASADSQLFVKGVWELMRQLSPEAQTAIDEAVESMDFTSQAYREAREAFSRTFLCRADPFPPEELARDMRHQAEDPTVRVSMLGPSPWVRNGSLKTYSSIPLLSKINVPTLVYNGEFDTTQYGPTLPLFNNIPRVRWTTLSGASHMPHLDSPEMQQCVLQLVSDFLRQDEAV